jgi:tRNA-dihydrouridine synthase
MPLSSSPERKSAASPSFFIGNIPIHGDLILAPMDGYTDQPFRTICRELGSAMSYTEFISAMEIIHGHPYLYEKLAFLPADDWLPISTMMASGCWQPAALVRTLAHIIDANLDARRTVCRGWRRPAASQTR